MGIGEKELCIKESMQTVADCHSEQIENEVAAAAYLAHFSFGCAISGPERCHTTYRYAREKTMKRFSAMQRPMNCWMP